MHDYDVDVAICLNCEIRGSWVRVQALGQDQYSHIVKIYEIIQNLYCNIDIWEKLNA